MADALRAAAAALGSTAEARTLVAHVLDVPLGSLVTHPDLTAGQSAELDHLVQRRSEGSPLQHLTGEAFFRRVRVEVGPGVFVPRPETEVMTGWAIEQVSALGSAVVVELCSGSGVIAKALADELPDSVAIHAVELDENAYHYATANLAGTRVDLVLGDMADACYDLDARVDLVIANPPYIPLEAYADVPADVRDYDPHLALFSGEDGLDAMRVVATTAHRLLRPGGLVCAEHADVQGESAPQIFVRHGGYDLVRDRPDLNGRPRFVTARRRGQASGREPAEREPQPARSPEQKARASAANSMPSVMAR